MAGVLVMDLRKEEKNFYKKLVLIGIPVVCQNLISNGLNLMDTLMIGMLGEAEIAAVGAANQVFFISTVILFGLYSGAAVFTAQYWGAGDIQGVRKMLGIDCITGLAVTLFFTCLALLFPEKIIGLFSRGPGRHNLWYRIYKNCRMFILYSRTFHGCFV